jgi:cytochrome c-type biogenesis protein CcmF
MGNVGYVALLIALCASLYSTAVFAAKARNNISHWLESAKNGLLAVCGLVTIAEFILLYAIFTHNFQLEYVRSYTSLNTSPLYLLSALWAGNSGSLLFWAWLLSVFSVAVLVRKQRTSGGLMPYAAMVLMGSEAFFLFLMVAVTNPFNKLDSAGLATSGHRQSNWCLVGLC